METMAEFFARRVKSIMWQMAMFIIKHALALALSILPYSIIGLTYGVGIFTAVSRLVVLTCSTVLLAVIYQFIRTYGPTRDFLLRLVHLIEYYYLGNLGCGQGSASFRVTHRLDGGQKTIRAQNQSSEDAGRHAMERNGIIGGLDQWAVTALVAYTTTWQEPYGWWYPFVQLLLGVPVGDIPTMLQMEQTEEGLPNRYFLIGVRVNPTHVQYLVYRFETTGNLNQNLDAIRNLGNADLIRVIKAFAENVQNLHDEEQSHLAIRPSNVFVHLDPVSLLLAEPTAVTYIPGAHDPDSYNAPEMHELQAEVGPRSDVYSLGRLFEMLVEGRNMPANLGQLFTRMSDPTPANRPNMDFIVQQLSLAI